jgi:acetyl-CoA carboxylase carboxyltransferase component
MREAVRDHIEAESLALFNTGLLYDDGIIDPRDTRAVLGIALSACHAGEVKGTDGFGVFRM